MGQPEESALPFLHTTQEKRRRQISWTRHLWLFVSFSLLSVLLLGAFAWLCPKPLKACILQCSGASHALEGFPLNHAVFQSTSGAFCLSSEVD